MHIAQYILQLAHLHIAIYANILLLNRDVTSVGAEGSPPVKSSAPNKMWLFIVIAQNYTKGGRILSLQRSRLSFELMKELLIISLNK